MTSSETINLMKKIRDGATSSDTSLGEVLRLCMRLGQQLSNKELTTWARKEASGYKGEDDLPDYRKLATEVRGTFRGPFGSGLNNAHIPKLSIDKKHREILYSIHLFEPVNQLEQYAKSEGSGTFQISWPADIIAYYQQREIYSNGLVLVSAWRLMSSQNILGVLETIRTRVLDFILQIQEELGVDIDEPAAKDEIDIKSSQAITNIFNNTINGGSVSLSNTGNASFESINISNGNITELKDYLSSIGLKKVDLEQLDSSIKEDGEVKEQLGPSVSSWLSNVSIKALKGGLNVGKDVAVSFITKALMQYYHLDS